MATASRFPADRIPSSDFAKLHHALWLCAEAKKDVDRNKMENAMRTLGFIQGILWSSFGFAIDDLKPLEQQDDQRRYWHSHLGSNP